MDESGKGNIPFIKGRRVGPDAIVSRDEQWAARAREANPPAKEWVYSTFPFYATEAVVLNQGLSTTLNLCIMPSMGGILEATSARIKVYTGVSGKDLRICLYRYHSDRKLSNRKRRLVKVLNSEIKFDCSAAARTTPIDVTLGGAGARITPGEPYFLGYRASSNSLMFPTASTNDIGHFPMYYQNHVDDESLPTELNLEAMNKTYQGNIPWVTYLSKEAAILF